MRQGSLATGIFKPLRGNISSPIFKKENDGIYGLILKAGKLVLIL